MQRIIMVEEARTDGAMFYGIELVIRKLTVRQVFGLEDRAVVVFSRRIVLDVKRFSSQNLTISPG